MVTYVDGWAARAARSRINRTCAICGGTIEKGSPYVSRDTRERGRRWGRHEHIDCRAAWWQTTLENLFVHLGQMPQGSPPEAITDKRLTDFYLLFKAEGDSVGQVQVVPPEHVAQQFLQIPDLELRAKVHEDIGNFLAIATDVLFSAMGNERASLMLSNVIQQLMQIKAVTLEQRKPK